MRTEIIDPKRNIALKAAAGSGKTFALGLRVVNLLLNGVEPERVLCITFTNKATNEMYQRIISLIRYLAFELSPSNIKEDARYLLLAQKGYSAEASEDVSLTNDEVNDLRKQAAIIYERVIRNISRLRISTIDSFLNSILRLFPFEAGVMPDFRILTPTKQERLSMNAFEHFVGFLEGAEGLKELVGDLIRKSGKAINSPATFLHPYFERLLEMRVAAGRLVQEMLPCLEEGEGNQCIVDNAAGLKHVGEKDVDIRIEARAFAKMLRERCPEISRPGMNELDRYASFDAASLAGLTSIAKDVYDEYRFFSKCGHDKKAQRLFEKMKKELELFIHLRNRVYRDAILYLFLLFAVELDREKAEMNSLTFSDVTNTCYRLLVDRGIIEEDPEYFYFRLDSKIDHLLIDEFQDTNFVQWLILRPFVDELTSGIGQREQQGSFFYVGDPKQSIYRFRGGESRLFDKVLDQYGGKIFSHALNRNFRSSESIVQFVNTVFNGISAAYDFAYEPQEAERENEGYVEVVFFDKEELKDTPDLKKEKVLAWIQGLKEKGYNDEEFAVLCGVNRECEEYAEYLKINGIPAVTEGSLTILHSRGVDAIIEILKYFNDTNQSIYLLNFLFSVPGLMDMRQLRTLLRGVRSDALSDDVKKKIETIYSRVNLLPVVSIIRMIIDEFDLFSRFERDPNIGLLLDAAASRELEDSVSLSGFLSFVEEELLDVRASRTEAVHAVKVLTIHKAKGLEFPFVLLPELEIGMSVSARETPLIFEYDEDLFIKNIYLNENRDVIRFHPELQDAAEKENTLTVRDRLNQLYVALTRAQEGLFVAAVIKENENKKKASGAFRVSDVLYNALGQGGYSKGGTSVKPPCAIEERRRAPRPQRIGDIIDFISSQRQEPEPLEEREEQYETRSFENYRARRLGVAFHYAVEVLREFSEQGIEDALRLVKQVYGSELSDNECVSIRARLKNLLDDQQFREMIRDTNIEKEMTFLRHTKVSIADLIAVGEDRIRVIDFKTNFEEELIERYKNQVRRYCNFAQEIYQKPTEGYLCFVLEDGVNYLEV